MIKKSSHLTILSSILIYLSALSANAQMVPPPSVDPGAVNSINSRNYADLIRNESINKAEEKTSVEEPVISGQTQLDVDTIKINKIAFSGNTILSTPELERLTSDLIGKDTSAEEIIEIIQYISDLYHKKGYLTSFAYISSLDIENGMIDIKLFEGKIGEININGTKWTRDSYIKNNIFKANNFSENKIFNVNDLNNSLRELNKNDYLKGQVSIQKGEKPETSDIVLNLKERIPLKLGASWDNMGRDLIGVQRANITLTDSNLTGFGDVLSGGVSLASGTCGANAGYSIPIGPYGTRFNFGYSFSHVNIGGIYKNLQIQGISHLFSPGLVQPIFRNNRFDISSDVSFDFNHSETNYLKSINLQEYDVRALRLGLNLTENDHSGMWVSRMSVSTGLPLMGATSKSGYGLGSSKFVKLNGSLTRVQRLPLRAMGILRLSGQFSPDALFASEQTQVGGMYTVRGYDEGLALGDIGYNASFEIRRPIPFLPNFSIPYWKGKKININLKDRIQLAGFYDQGLAKPIHQEMRATFLQSIGAGLRINLTKYIMANVDLGIPLGKKITPDQNAVRMHFGLSSDIF